MVSKSNWAGNVAWGAAETARPTTVEEVQSAVARSSSCRVVGSGHSFNRIADTSGTHLDLSGLDSMELLDDGRVRIGGGTRYAELGAFLHDRGRALANLASLPHITVAGSVATGTHGSGDGNGHLGTSVSAIELVNGQGELVRIERGDAEFAGAVVALGALGAVVALELETEPSYDVAQEVWLDLPLSAAIESFDGVMGSVYSVSFFTRWHPPSTGADLLIDQVWRKRRIAADPGRPFDLAAAGARPAGGAVHPVAEMDATACTTQGSVAGPWHRRLPHFRPEHRPSAGDELQAEIFVDRAVIGDALAAVAETAEVVAPVLWVSEIRTVAADDAWLSPTQGVPAVALHFTLRPDTEAAMRALGVIEDALAPLGGRPHWGKLTTRDATRLQAVWGESLAEFASLRRRFDPAGRFLNPHLSQLLRSIT